VQPAEVSELAALPGKPELYAKLLFRLAGADGSRSSAG
jgi:ribosomal protein L10